MKKIVIDARESGTTSGRYTDKLIEHLHYLKPEYEFVLLAKTHRLEYLKKVAPSFSIVEANFKEFTFAEQLGFLKCIKQQKADLVHFPFVQQPVLYRGRVVTTMQDLTGIRFRNPTKNWLVFTIKQGVYRWVNKYVARKSKLLITPTKFVQKDVADYCGVSPSKITVTYEAADLISGNPEPVKQLEGKQFIMYVGRPQPHKNLERLVDAFEILKNKHPDLHLVFVGKLDDAYRRLQKYARKVPDVIFTDFVSDEGLKWLYGHASAYTFPSLSEGFGLPPMEAMLNAFTPVISSNATCLPEVYKDAALYFDPLDINDMAAAIDKVLTDKKLVAELSQKGHELAKTYSWERMAKQTLAVYKQALDDK